MALLTIILYKFKKKSIVLSKTFSLRVLTSIISVIIIKPNYFFHDLKYLIF